MLREKGKHEVGKGACQVEFSGLKNLIIFVQFVVIAVLFYPVAICNMQ